MKFMERYRQIVFKSPWTCVTVWLVTLVFIDSLMEVFGYG